MTLQTAAVDATSYEDTLTLVQGIKKPLGGCILLTVSLVDAMLTSQTQENFERCFPPKTLAFQVLERAVDVTSLDFFITFSSVAGMFGNPGQTSYAA